MAPRLRITEEQVTLFLEGVFYLGDGRKELCVTRFRPLRRGDVRGKCEQ